MRLTAPAYDWREVARARRAAAKDGIDSDPVARVEELERERELLNAIANYAPSLLCLIDPDGTVRPAATNKAFELTLGYPPEETGGVRFWERYVPPRGRRRGARGDRGGRPRRGGGEHDGRWLTREGEIVHVLWSCTSLPMIESGPLFLVSGTDITERKRQAVEVRTSRARIVAAGDDARRRLERNLHDGAQQRLMALLLSLRLARTRAGADPELAGLLDTSVDELAAAVKELRELARGIHPEVLTRRGLPAALRMMAARMPLPVELDVPPERQPEHVEAAVYYVVSESLANVVRYSGAARVSVCVRAGDGRLEVEVSDDGAGGADPAVGTGLRGLADRVAALDGSLTVESPAGSGTRVRAVLPLDS